MQNRLHVYRSQLSEIEAPWVSEMTKGQSLGVKRMMSTPNLMQESCDMRCRKAAYA
jgi:hypothetical protein